MGKHSSTETFENQFEKRPFAKKPYAENLDKKFVVDEHTNRIEFVNEEKRFLENI